jgi:hypothetical protein
VNRGRHAGAFVIGEWLKSAGALAITLSLLLAALAGCSMVRLGYGQLDTYAAWTADEYFDLEPHQRQEFLARFERLHEWHRHEQLPDYASFLAAARARVQRGLEREDLIWLVDGFRGRYRAIVERGADDAAAMLMTITPEQLAALQRKWEKDNRRFIREHRVGANTEERQRARIRRTLSQIRDWVGGLTYEQEQKIITMTNAAPMIDGLRHEDRLRRQREFLQLMETRGDSAEFTARFRRWLLHWEEGRAPEYERLFTEWWEKRVEMLVALDRMLTPHQRGTVAHRLQGYIEDFTRLSERPDAHAAASR